MTETIVQQRQKERKALKLFLLTSLVGSMAFHAGVMALKVGDRWSNLPADLAEEEMEVVVEDAPPEQPIPEVIAEVTPPPEPDVPQEVAFAPEVAPPPPLAPESPTPLPKGEDAPSDKPATTPDAAQPMTNSSGDTNLKVGGGPIFKPFGTGFGFGNTTRPTGFNPLGQPDGKPQGQPGGNPNSTAVRSAPPAKPKEPVCVSCPKPKYQGREASPRVEMNVRPDGSVEVRLRKSSGNPDLDRQTLETMSKWRFDPQSIPEGGVKKRVRVTYEEEGSSTQRQNEERRRQETERQQVADQERQQREAQERQRQQPTTAVEAPVKPSPAPAAPPLEPPTSEKPVAPVPAAAPVEPPPAPVEVAPPPVEPAPAPPEPAPVEAAPASGQ